MLTTLLGIVTLVSPAPRKAESLMAVTGRPLIVPGIPNTPPGPL